MPYGASILHVGVQDAQLYVWAEVNTTAPLVDRHFHIAGTGHPIPVGLHFVGSVMDGPFVWHVYDGGESYKGGVD